MHRLATPLLRRVYLVFSAFVALYLAVLIFEYSHWNKERLFRKLVRGGESEKASAGFDLAYLNGERQLIRALKSDSPEVRVVAMNSLWDLWTRAGGHQAFRQVQAANRAMERNARGEALQILTVVTKSYPRFSEGWNRRATLYWQLGKFNEAIADASKAVALNPNHFGAWQGLGLCHAHLGDMEQACQCIRTALKITPHDEALQKLLRQCEKVLDRRSPGEKPDFKLI